MIPPKFTKIIAYLFFFFNLFFIPFTYAADAIDNATDALDKTSTSAQAIPYNENINLEVSQKPTQEQQLDYMADNSKLEQAEVKTSSSEPMPVDTSSHWDKAKSNADKAWGETKNMSVNAWKSTKKTSTKVWETTKHDTEKSWTETKAASSNAWKTTKEGSEEAWKNTKEYSNKAWDSTKSTIHSGAEYISEKTAK